MTEKKRPLIGVTMTSTAIPSPSGLGKRVELVNSAFVDLITRFGGHPFLIPNGGSDGEALTEILDGLLLTSGCDIDPEHYRQEQHVRYDPSVRGSGEPFRRPWGARPHPERDALELKLYHGMAQRGRPVLGICRGMQIINVAHGGTLHQELPATATLAHELGQDGWIPHHRLQVSRNTLTHTLLGVDELFISSVHHQAIDRLGDDLIAAARAPDGVIEIIEGASSNRFVMGILGHLEQGLDNLPEFHSVLLHFIERSMVS